jgi:hypothetical protein
MRSWHTQHLSAQQINSVGDLALGQFDQTVLQQAHAEKNSSAFAIVNAMQAGIGRELLENSQFQIQQA